MAWQSVADRNFGRFAPSHKATRRTMAEPMHEETLPHDTHTHLHTDSARAQ